MKTIYLPKEYSNKKIIQTNDIEWLNTINIKIVSKIKYEADWKRFLKDVCGINSDENVYNMIIIYTKFEKYVLRTSNPLNFIEKILKTTQENFLKISLKYITIDNLLLFQKVKLLKMYDCSVSDLKITLPLIQKVKFNKKNMLSHEIINFIHLNSTLTDVTIEDCDGISEILQYITTNTFIKRLSLFSNYSYDNSLISKMLENNNVIEFVNIQCLNCKLNKISITKLGQNIKEIYVPQLFDINSIEILIRHHCDGSVRYDTNVDEIFNLFRKYPNSALLKQMIKFINYQIDKK